MNRIMSMGVLALMTLLASEQQAPAWVNFKFSAGVNWHWQSGNNSILWGLWKDGQAPGPEVFHTNGHGYHPGMHGPDSGQFPFFGGGARLQPNAAQPASTPTPPPAPPATAQQAYGFNTIPAWGPSNVYQPVSYTPYSYNPGVYYPNHYPSYWYGR